MRNQKKIKAITILAALIISPFQTSMAQKKLDVALKNNVDVQRENSINKTFKEDDHPKNVIPFKTKEQQILDIKKSDSMMPYAYLRSGYADLRPGLHEEYSEGQICSFRLEVRNFGSVKAEKSKLRFKYIVDSAGEPKEIIVNVPEVPAAKGYPGYGIALSDPIEGFDIYADADTIRYEVEVDVYNDVVEGGPQGELNNLDYYNFNYRSFFAHNCKAKRPDLTVTSSKWDAQCNLRINVANIGEAASGPAPYGDFQLHVDGIVSSGGSTNYTNNFERLKKGESREIVISGYYGVKDAPQYMVEIDYTKLYPQGTIIESNEDNNKYYSEDDELSHLCEAPEPKPTCIPGIYIIRHFNSNEYLTGYDEETGKVISDIQVSFGVDPYLNIAWLGDTLFMRDGTGNIYSIDPKTGAKKLWGNIGNGAAMGSSEEGLVMDFSTHNGKDYDYLVGVYKPLQNKIVKTLSFKDLFTNPNLHMRSIEDISDGGPLHYFTHAPVYELMIPGQPLPPLPTPIPGNLNGASIILGNFNFTSKVINAFLYEVPSGGLAAKPGGGFFVDIPSINGSSALSWFTFSPSGNSIKDITAFKTFSHDMAYCPKMHKN